jgi:hypothetical protein
MFSWLLMVSAKSKFPVESVCCYIIGGKKKACCRAHMRDYSIIVLIVAFFQCFMIQSVIKLWKLVSHSALLITIVRLSARSSSPYRIRQSITPD